MFAFIAGEWKEWRSRGSRRSLLAAILATALAGVPTLLHPLATAAALTVLAIGAGWASGNRFQAAGSTRAYVVGCPLVPRDVFAGKAAAGAALFFFHAFALSPALALMAILWGLSPTTLAVCLACWLAAFAFAQALGIVASLLYSGSDALFGLAVAAAWLLPGFLLPFAGMSNPFMQVWMALRRGRYAAPVLGALGLAVAAALLLALASSLLARIRRREDA